LTTTFWLLTTTYPIVNTHFSCSVDNNNNKQRWILQILHQPELIQQLHP
jgi:hypothetical protein